MSIQTATRERERERERERGGGGREGSERYIRVKQRKGTENLRLSNVATKIQEDINIHQNLLPCK